MSITRMKLNLNCKYTFTSYLSSELMNTQPNSNLSQSTIKYENPKRSIENDEVVYEVT